MKKAVLFILFLTFSSLSAQSEYPAVHGNFNSMMEDGYTGFGFLYSERGLDDIDISYEIGANILMYDTEWYEEDNTNANLTFALGPYFNLNLTDNASFVPFIGIVGGVGYFFRDETLNSYANDLEEFTDNIESERELPPDGAFLHWNASIGFDWFIFGRADYGHAGINVSYNIGKFKHISAGFTFDFGFFDSL